MSKVHVAVILAGGLGTRLRSEVPTLPKPMAPVAGRPFLEHLMLYWRAQGIDRFVLSVGYRHEAIQGYFGNEFQGAAVEYVIESEPLGTGGGVLLAAQKLDSAERFLLLNGDTYFAVVLPTLEAFALTHDTNWCFSLFRTQEAGRYMGMDIGPQGQVRGVKSSSGEVGGLANGGVYLVHPRALAGLVYRAGMAASLEDDLFEAALRAGQPMFGLEFGGTFIDIGVPVDYRRAPQVLGLEVEE
ncbi:sugar phosphate nucleotidyltransferase [Denitratisoma sp. agr-D3]